tara:strand:+ start:4463 stop:4927 length:465 start_codon:yes stop_codon:yes gene_type:complete
MKQSKKAFLNYMVINTRHIGLVVNNLDSTIKFYNSLGFKVINRKIEQGEYIEKLVKIKDVKLEWVKLKLIDDSILELLKYHGNEKKLNKPLQKSNKFGWSHISFTVKSIINTIKIINENGGKADNNFQFSPDGKVKVLYCNDIEGNILEIVEEI